MERMLEDRMSRQTIDRELSQIANGWEFCSKHNAIEKTFERKDFMDSVHFIERIAKVAEQHDHHPDLLLFDYKNVRVTFTTHSASGVTQNDFDMARAVDRIP